MWTIQSNNNKNRSSKHQTKIYSNYKQKKNINSRSVCGQFKATTTKTDQVSIKQKYSNYKQKWNISSLPRVWTIQSNNNKNRSSKYQTKIYSNYKQKWSINSLSVCGQFKATTTKTDEVSIKTKYIQNINKNETLTHFLYVDNSSNNNQNRSTKYQTIVPKKWIY